eukprot:TRINITY_DN8591_c0_g2_i2.p1 TRINITY_DN8591_c0_g2~~TRINITY_DN8591_c0_g2_i2.p1  ORF type:complete len:599 (+),score=126.33 TRINITY_DN8591_c0_g2_i2:88-1884(+)
MAAEAQPSIHLMATASDGSHSPQVFRMRLDQQLRRFAKAYAQFRQLDAEAESELRLWTPSHGELDTSNTASMYGLFDGDMVMFTRTSTKSAEDLPKNEGEVDAQVASVQGPDTSAATVAGLSSAKASSAHASDTVAEIASKNASAGGGVAVVAAAGAGGAAAAGGTVAAGAAAGGAGGAAAAGKNPRVSAAKAKTRPVATPQRPRRSVEIETAPAESGNGRGRGRAKGRGAAAAATSSRSLVAAEPKRRGRRSASEPPARKAAQAPAKKLATKVYLAEGAEEIEQPNALQRSTPIKAGPAKGWRVVAWLEEQSSGKASVRWRATSPGRSHSFDVLGSRRPSPELEEFAGTEAYAQIFSDVRPKLIQRLNACKKTKMEGVAVTTPPPRNRIRDASSVQKTAETTASSARGGANKRAKNTNVVQHQPQRSASAFSSRGSDLATQLFIRPAAGGVLESPQLAAAWRNCKCFAHLRRHDRCVLHNDGIPQPVLVHLRDYMLVGRGEMCDVVLDSKRCPNMISRCHAVLNLEDDGFAIIDQGSMNGVLVNGHKVAARQLLCNEDVITFGVPQTNPEFDYIYETRPEEMKSSVPLDEDDAEDAW